MEALPHAIGREEKTSAKLSFFADDIFVGTENPKECTKNNL
jgi:hypothetical protein